MIDENKLVMEIANWQMGLAPEYKDRDKAIWEALQEVIETIETQPKTDEWNSVEDKLPPRFEVVIVTDGDECELAAWQYENHWGLDFDYIDSGQDITHWMPLPEPPGREGK